MAVLYKPTDADVTLPAAGGKRCSKCGRVKPATFFTPLPATDSQGPRLHSWCKQCVRIAGNLYRETREGRESIRAYNGKPEVRAAKTAWQARNYRTPSGQAKAKAYRSTDVYRARNRLRLARIRLSRATTDEQRQRLQALIDRHTAALAALDAEDE